MCCGLPKDARTSEVRRLRKLRPVEQIENFRAQLRWKRSVMWMFFMSAMSVS